MASGLIPEYRPAFLVSCRAGSVAALSLVEMAHPAIGRGVFLPAVGRQAHATPAARKRQGIGFLRSLAKTPSRIRGYFNNETTRYAAAA